MFRVVTTGCLSLMEPATSPNLRLILHYLPPAVAGRVGVDTNRTRAEIDHGQLPITDGGILPNEAIGASMGIHE